MKVSPGQLVLPVLEFAIVEALEFDRASPIVERFLNHFV